MARGGRRVGRSGARYGNRSDLQLAPRQPVQAIPGQVYGARKAQEDAQRAVPLSRPGSPQPTGQGPAVSPFPVAPPVPLDAPTQNPNEPVTAGSRLGAGPGPEALAFGRPQRLSELLSALGPTGDLADLLVFARQRGL